MMNVTQTLLKSYRGIFAVYCLLLLCVFSPVFFGNVIAPHRQQMEVAATQSGIDQPIENRKFSDYSQAYIPEIINNLKGPGTSWLKLWSNTNELGRPTYHLSGFSPAYPLSWLLFQLTDNPWVFITLMTILTSFLAGMFIIIFCYESSLAPIAALVAGVSLATSPLFMYWLTFPMFSATWCWAAGAICGMKRLAKRSDLLGWSILSFSVYSILMTGYPQPVVYHAYLMLVYGFYLLLKQYKHNRFRTGRFVLTFASACTVGIALTLPVYIDLLHIAAESARGLVNEDFLTLALPKIHGLKDFAIFIILSTVPEIFGNLIAPNYPFQYNGLSLTPLILFFSAVGLCTCFKKNWGWWLAVCLSLLFAFIPSLYVLGIKYLGFNLSRSNPLSTALVPLVIICAHGVNTLASCHLYKIRHALLAAGFAVMLIILLGIYCGLNQHTPIRWSSICIMLVITILLTLQYRHYQPTLLLTALALGLAFFSYPLVLYQPIEQIATQSPLTEEIKKNLPNGTRFAVISPALPYLGPNINATIGLNSIHSYNSLSPRYYHDLIRELGGEVHTYGRWNNSIQPDYTSNAFWMSNIGIVLSATTLNHPSLTLKARISDVSVYTVDSRMGEALLVNIPEQEYKKTEDIQMDNIQQLPALPIERVISQGDILTFHVDAQKTSLLVLSQKYHRDWQAFVKKKTLWESTKTIRVNKFFQGIKVPTGTQVIQLAFRPYARYAAIAHITWLFFSVILGINIWRNLRGGAHS